MYKWIEFYAQHYNVCILLVLKCHLSNTEPLTYSYALSRFWSLSPSSSWIFGTFWTYALIRRFLKIYFFMMAVCGAYKSNERIFFSSFYRNKTSSTAQKPEMKLFKNRFIKFSSFFSLQTSFICASTAYLNKNCVLMKLTIYRTKRTHTHTLSSLTLWWIEFNITDEKTTISLNQQTQNTAVVKSAFNNKKKTLVKTEKKSQFK